MNLVAAATAGLHGLLLGGAETGALLARSNRITVLSATGSTRMGRRVAVAVAERFGRSILELGGNNAMIVAPGADLALAVRAITFAAVGTAGQRCTSLRRLIIHDDIAATLIARLEPIFGRVEIGDPFDEDTLVGPLIDRSAFDAMQTALAQARAEGRQVHGGERVRRDLGDEETGGGRESGSDAWKAYRRRATNTINYSDRLPLAQGVYFDVE